MWSQVLVITGYKKLASYLVTQLAESGHRAKVFQDSAAGLAYLKDHPLSLVFIGWQPSDINIIDFCQRLRAIQTSIPLIALLQSDAASDRVACLNAGASDCISSPFDLNELLARVRAQLRSHALSESHQLHYDDVMLDLKSYQVSRGDRLIQLTAKEFRLLEYLMRHPQQVLTRDQILDNVWGYDFIGTSNIVEVYIRCLRGKLEAHHKKRLIQTIRSVGYVLRA